MLDELDGQSLPKEFDDLIIFDQRPNFDDMDKSLMDVSWIYGIDLDHNVFRVNGIPFYSLECLPEPEDFPKHVVNDFYDNLACAPECPPKYKYKRPAAPVVDDSDLKTYGSLVCTGPDASLSGLLGINDTLSTNEQVRVSLLEMMIGQCIYSTHLKISRLTHEFEFISNHNQLMDEEWLAGCSLIRLAFVPQVFDVRSMFAHPTEWPSRKEFIWAREDTVICLATHLDNERCLQASMSRLIKTILEQRDAPGDYFGVAFSVSQCAIVKVVKDAYTATFSHTAALQFLPSFFSESPSTPGIIALARLGYRIDPALFVRVMNVWCHSFYYPDLFAHTRIDGAPPSVNSVALPAELCYAVKQPRRYSATRMSLVIAWSQFQKRCQGVRCALLLSLLNEPALLLVCLSGWDHHARSLCTPCSMLRVQIAGFLSPLHGQSSLTPREKPVLEKEVFSF